MIGDLFRGANVSQQGWSGMSNDPICGKSALHGKAVAIRMCAGSETFNENGEMFRNSGNAKGYAIAGMSPGDRPTFVDPRESHPPN